MTKIFISEVREIKRGKNKFGKDWTLYKVITPENKEYSTFEAKYISMKGMEVDVDVEENVVEKNGRTFTNLTIVEPKQPRAGSWATKSEVEELRGEMESLSIEVARIGKIKETKTDTPF